MARWKWKLNASTGNYIHQIDGNTRLIRYGTLGPYRCEYWGDYSLKFPVTALWRTTAAEAARDAEALRNDNPAAA